MRILVIFLTTLFLTLLTGCTSSSGPVTSTADSGQRKEDSINLKKQISILNKRYLDDTFNQLITEIDTQKLESYPNLWLFLKSVKALRQARTNNSMDTIKKQYINLLHHSKRLKNRHFEAVALKYIGKVYLYEKQWDSAYLYFHKSANIAMANKDSIVAANNYLNLSNLKAQLRDTAQKDFYLLRAIEIHKNQKNKYNLIKDYLNFSEIFANRGKIDSAYYYYNLALPLHKDFKGNFEDRKAFTEGYILYKDSNYKEALTLFKKCVETQKSDQFLMGTKFALSCLKNLGRFAEMKPLIHNLNKFPYKNTQQKSMLVHWNYIYYKHTRNFKVALENVEEKFILYKRLEKEKSREKILINEQKIASLKQGEKLKLAEQEKGFLKKQRWLWVGLTALLLLLPILYLRQRAKKKKKEYQMKLTEMQMASLKSQMNPHFMFNNINSIKGLIINDAAAAAADQLTKFSKLMRNILNYASEESITVEKELEFIQLYADLETYKAHRKVKLIKLIDPEIETNEVSILPFLIQPFIENCFKHAFDDSISDPQISLTIKKKKGKLNFKVSDNGIGIKAPKPLEHVSKATELIEKRLSLRNNNSETLKWNFRGAGKGTEVSFNLSI